MCGWVLRQKKFWRKQVLNVHCMTCRTHLLVRREPAPWFRHSVVWMSQNPIYHDARDTLPFVVYRKNILRITKQQYLHKNHYNMHSMWKILSVQLGSATAAHVSEREVTVVSSCERNNNQAKRKLEFGLLCLLILLWLTRCKCACPSQGAQNVASHYLGFLKGTTGIAHGKLN